MAEFAHPPIRRHPALKPLSRDHYRGLAAAQQLHRAADGDGAARRDAVAALREAWRRELADHLADEERLLTPWMGPPDHRRLEREHAAIRGFAEEAAGMPLEMTPSREWLRAAAAALHDHIRWEERALFGRIEAAAGEAGLTRLADETSRIEAARPRQRG